MLTLLRIRDLALIDDVALEPGAGLVVFTGETGAGKSILLDGLALLAGQRATTDQVRSGAAEAIVEGAFRPAGPVAAALRADEALELDGEEILARRTVGPNGSRAYLDDRLVTVGTLRRVGDRLVEIAGQHESQELLGAAAHLRVLDRFGGLSQERDRVAAAWDEATDLQRRLQEVASDERERAQRADYLRFLVREIRGAGLDPGEESSLVAERRRLRHAGELSAAAAEALDVLYEREHSAVAMVARAQQDLERIVQLDESAGLDPGRLAEARFTIEDIARALQEYLEGLESDPGRLDAVEERLAAIDRLRRKYGDSVEEILHRADEAAAELESLENRDQEIERLTARLRETVREYDRAAGALGQRRRAAAARLQDSIGAELQQLGMEGARFRVEVRSETGRVEGGLPPGAGRRGYDGVEFLLAANPGEPARPLAKVASGGELSRVMLALKLAEMHGAPPQTLVFDEIDAGVGGGRVADRLADRLARLAGSHQVLVVTHLPQIAARAGTHVLVHKRETGGRTVVSVARLEAEERVEELARMLGGVEVTEDLRRHARSLLG